MSKNSYGYVVVRWEAEPPAKKGAYPKVTFTVLDAGEGKKEKRVGSLKMYGEKIREELPAEIGNAVIDAQYHQRHDPQQ